MWTGMRIASAETTTTRSGPAGAARQLRNHQTPSRAPGRMPRCRRSNVSDLVGEACWLGRTGDPDARLANTKGAE